MDELLPVLDEQAKMKPDIVPEWHPETKYARLLRLNKRFELVDILHTDTYEGKIHDWCMGYIRARQPDIVLLNFGEHELCNMDRSTFHVASRYIEVARTLISEEYRVGHVLCVGAIPLAFGIPCTPSRFRKRVYGFNTKMETMTQPRLGFKFLSQYWKNGDGHKVDPNEYAPMSFTPGPEPNSSAFVTYVNHLRKGLLDSITIMRQNDFAQYGIPMV